MTPAQAEIEIEAPADQIWSLLTTFRRWPEWGPSVRAVEAEVDVLGPGVSGWVQTAVGLWLPFRIDDFEAGRAWGWSVAGIPATGHRVTPLSDARTRVVFTVPRLFLPYRWVLSRALRRLKRIAETG